MEVFWAREWCVAEQQTEWTVEASVVASEEALVKAFVVASVVALVNASVEAFAVWAGSKRHLSSSYHSATDELL